MPTKIEWCDETLNPLRTVDGGYHCTKVSPGCQNCYAEPINNRFGNGRPYNAAPTEFVIKQSDLEKPLHWRKPRRIFVQSMSDLFHEDVPFSLIEHVFAAMEDYDWHIYFILTKRPERMMQFIDWYWRRSEDKSVGLEWGMPSHIWLGVTAENQKMWDERTEILTQIPAAVRFVSIEPMLGPIVMRKKAANEREIIEATMMGLLADYSRPVPHGIDWVIAGGETGPGARPVHPDWVRSLRDQCQAAGVPFFFKSWGEYCAPSQMPPETYRVWDIHHGTENCWKEDDPRWKVGKKNSGRLLDGQEWNQFPGASSC